MFAATRIKYANFFHYLIDLFSIQSFAIIQLNGTFIQLHNFTTQEKYRREKNLLRIQLGDLMDEMNEIDEKDKNHIRLQQKIEKIRKKIQSLPLLDTNSQGFAIAHGGCKKVYAISASHVIALPNLDTYLDYARSTQDYTAELKNWHRIVDEEIFMATKLQKLKLETQQQSKIVINYKHHHLPALMMPNFHWLAKEQGYQVRDYKNEYCFGSSMLFGSCKNITKENLKKIFVI
ncbi:MAG: hypothetical protein KIT56_11380, partial [Gammaproteobacteria bacterium]|nr:hypothetical protein [Gammaproteobacteria bacterium]MCW5584447.1 hypothetical protein [Gammaproteobacteria bacterium]